MQVGRELGKSSIEKAISKGYSREVTDDFSELSEKIGLQWRGSSHAKRADYVPSHVRNSD
jgi:hypothetical protein